MDAPVATASAVEAAPTPPADPTPTPEIEAERPSLKDIGRKVAERMNEPAPKPDAPKTEEPVKAAEPGEKTDKPPVESPDLSKFSKEFLELLAKSDQKLVEDALKGHVIPKHRFDEVNGRFRAYESLGTPEELRAMVEKIKNPPPPPEPETPPIELSDEQKSMRDEMLKLFPHLKGDNPGLKSVSEEVQKLKTEREQEKKAVQERERVENERQEKEWNAHREKAEKEVNRLILDEKKWNPENKVVLNSLSGSVFEAVNEDKALAERLYIQKDLTVLKEVFDNLKNALFSGVERATNAKILSDKQKQVDALPKAPIKGGPPATGTETKRYGSFRKMEKAIRERLNGS